MASSMWRALKRNKTFRYGAPMLLLIVGGSFGLREFTQIRYDAQKLKRKIDPALQELISKKNVTLESEYEKIKESSYEDWKNVRGPRPWEDSKSFQDEQRRSAISKAAWMFYLKRQNIKINTVLIIFYVNCFPFTAMLINVA
ncbi:hypothetical protein GDO86_010235 [Hymenochirus boettgeri]|uniref:Cytochrome c oxidase assembly protein COX16 homolog, mitochondrial n=1 Tax=Hymenochirus boettgeri TaxID=247094 RepID=A0A8T2JPR8_9PIPI|nr:hypothetical protein GDO86_010235 [Hymenochirus boettgeri]KAG8445371.1 hypothetical protein GDO86_010235 [Hymenochirus boettgeri]